jgi:uncharacterized membrane protein YbhN (UPF0104 family)
VTGVRVLIGVALVGVLATQLDFGEMRQRMDGDLLLMAVVSLLLMFLAFFLTAVRWQAILGPQSPSLSGLFELCLVGGFFGLFLPTSVGGDAVRIVALGRSGVSPSRSVTSVLLDRLFGLAALVIVLLTGVVLSLDTAGELIGLLPEGAPVVLAATSFAILAVLGLLIVLGRGRVLRSSRRLRDALALILELSRSPGRSLLALLVAVVIQILHVVAWFLLARGVEVEVSPGFMLIAAPLVSLAAMIPVSISGIGLREGAWLLLLANRGASNSAAVLMSVTYFGAFAAVCAIGGVIFMRSGLKLDTGSGAGATRAEPSKGEAASPGQLVATGEGESI